MRWAAALLIALTIGLSAAAARAETLIAAMSSHQIQITSNYTGSQLTVFGQVERDGRTVARGDPYDIIVTVRGPRRMLLVRKKERLGPIWINRTQRRFPDNPVFLHVASSRPITEMMGPEAAQRDRIGLTNAERPSDDWIDLDPDARRFRESLVRIMQGKGLYGYEERGVTFLSSALFSAPVDIPATAPTGSYTVDIVLYSGGVPLARQQTNFEVIKTGIEQRLASGAYDWSLLYGLMTVLLALFLGWGASVVFRRD
ncbi:TIGR02186 family protein [Bosea sp. (in: a-proteobacteria)]|uniref:TIGR02186 family protein n=1 Tax=Bosea sp. (in: a-proteobacteria) TaxID=1871050 RepID=UPI0026060B88|nr:TIGR02186 family protein [Bosea sp. (in: a-proteobacteria)]MCO5089390.1 TIGR02186 family protein [Bosea sp. (in: a-proteobacteria)]